MSQNHFQGPIPVEFCQHYLFYLDLSENNLSGSVPSCLNSPTHVRPYRNRLDGPMPWGFSNSTSLITLDLTENHFSFLGNVENHFSGRIPTWISNHTALIFLPLKSNNFEGNIPKQLCQLDQLRILDISQNNLFGSLPPCLGNMIPFKADDIPPSYYEEDGHTIQSLLPCIRCTIFLKTDKDQWFLHPRTDFGLDGTEGDVGFTTKRRSEIYKGDILLFMSGIDFSCNQLTGDIPPEIGNLKNIYALNLSHNNFTGSIPMTFSNLRQLESLDLSYNNLNGQIPSQLLGLNSLAVFSVAHNNLSGMTPDQKGQFGTFDESSYAGNPLLCGPPLDNSCNEIKLPSLVPNSSYRQAEEDGFIDMGVFYWSFVASYVTVLLGILAVLYINPYWRQAWLYLIEVCITTSYSFFVDNFRKLFNFGNI